MIDLYISKRFLLLEFLWLIQPKNQFSIRVISDIISYQALIGKVLDLAFLQVFRP